MSCLNENLFLSFLTRRETAKSQAIARFEVSIQSHRKFAKIDRGMHQVDLPQNYFIFFSTTNYFIFLFFHKVAHTRLVKYHSDFFLSYYIILCILIRYYIYKLSCIVRKLDFLPMRKQRRRSAPLFSLHG